MKSNELKIAKNKFFTLETENRRKFYQVPKQFMDKSSKYFNMNLISKLLYGILLDRHSLSIKNNWLDKENRIYFIFIQAELCDLLGVKDPKTVRKYLKQLEEYNLLYRKKQGKNLPDLLYLLQIDTEQNNISEDNNKTGKDSPSKQGDIPSQDKDDSPKNNTKINNIDKNNTKKEKKSIKEINKDIVQINIETNSNLSFSTLKDKEKDLKVILPKEIYPLATTPFIQRLKADRDFKGLDFDTKSYNSLIDAITITSEKDKVEMLGISQYAYFKNTLINILKMQKTINNNKQNNYADEDILGW